MGKSFIEPVVALAACSLMTCSLPNKLIHFPNCKGRALALGRDSANNMANKRMFAYKRRLVFLKERGLFPPWTRKKKAVGTDKMCVSFGRITCR